MKKNKKILFPFVGDSLGGSHISTLMLIDELQNSNYDVEILLYSKGILSKYLDENDYEYFLEENMFFCPKGRFFSIFFKIIRANFSSIFFLRKKTFDVVHTNDIRMHYSWFIASSLLSKHIWHQRSIAKNSMFLAIFSSKVITITDFCKKSFPVIFRSKAIVVKDPVYIEKKSAEDVKESNIIKLLWVANLVKSKRIEDALYIIKKIKESHKVILNVVGELREPVYSEACLLIKELGIADSVNFVGFSSNIAAWISSSDILLATAENEGMGRTLIEAMLLGTPVVASADGGHLEVITNQVSGLLVPLGDIDGFCSAVLKLKFDTFLSSKLTNNARSLAMSEFSPKTHKEQIVRLYDI